MNLILVNVAESTVISTRVKNVGAQFSMLGSYFSQTKSLGSMESKEFETLAEDIAGMFMSRIQVIDTNFNIIIDTYQINKGKICVSQDVNKCFNGTNSSYADKKNKSIIFTQAIKNPKSDEVEYVLFATASISDVLTSMEYIRMVGLAVEVILIIMGIFFAIFGSHKLVSPFNEINKTVEDIENGHMTEDINMKGCTEVETISSSFNTMLNRINQLEKSRQEFVSNVSHELKTPLTSMKVLADSLTMMPDAPLEMYQEFMVDMSNEIDRENAIITDLLTLVKMDNPGAGLSISNVNINELVEATMKRVRPLADQKRIDMVLESFRPIYADVDQMKLSMAISNLVENAVKYNNPDGWVHVSMNSDRTYFYIKVQDNGFGIPSDSLDRIFERFYRVDKARDRAAGGTGLGLAITKEIVAAHRGTIKVYSDETGGSTFSMQIPLTYKA